MFLGEIVVHAIQTDREREYERAARARRMLEIDASLPSITAVPAVPVASKNRQTTCDSRGRSANVPA